MYLYFYMQVFSLSDNNDLRREEMCAAPETGAGGGLFLAHCSTDVKGKWIYEVFFTFSLRKIEMKHFFSIYPFLHYMHVILCSMTSYSIYRQTLCSVHFMCSRLILHSVNHIYTRTNDANHVRARYNLV